MQKKKILVVDDDVKLTEIIDKYLTQYEFKVTVANDGKDIENLVKTIKPDIIILDVMLPDKNGFDILRDLQKDFDIPIIMLTAKGDEIDKVIGLELGADDYITKPFSIRELVARLRTVLRRTSQPLADTLDRKELMFPNIRINPDRRVLVIDDTEYDLTKTEFEILYLLASNPDRTYTREELLKSVSERDYEVFDRSIDMHISHLRNKLKKQKEENCSIKTVWGSGYRFEIKKDNPQ
ncbi:MAG: response regulator transcription factor [Spirochaetes bacterium]|nr:response regulator transcription factor [Spirochaetota bacterium]